MGKLNLLFGSVVVFVVAMLVFVPVYLLLAALGLWDDLGSTVTIVILSVAAVLGIPATVMVRRRLPPAVEALLEEDNDGEDELGDDATPAIFGVSDPHADSDGLPGADAGLAPPDESQLSGPR